MPRSEEFRITSQLLRASASVPANVAEGWTRATRKDYARFVSIARGSVAEVETFLLLSVNGPVAGAANAGRHGFSGQIGSPAQCAVGPALEIPQSLTPNPKPLHLAPPACLTKVPHLPPLTP